MRNRSTFCCLLATCLVMAACDIPTDPPIVEQRWILPLDDVTLEQVELLPIAVSIVGDLYSVAVDTVSASESLGTLCPSCSSSGFPVPVPAYQGQFTSVDNLPNDVLAAEVESGSVDVTISNNFSFDPIAGGGSMTITVRGAGGGTVLGTLVLLSATDALPPLSMTTRTLTIGAGTVTGALETRVEIDSPGTQNAPLDVLDDISISAVTTSLLVSEATVDVDGLPASLSEETLDTEDLDEGVTDAIVSGTVVLDVTNPFGLTFTGMIAIGAVVKNVTVTSAATSMVLVPYTGAELRSFLGVPGITLSGDGTIGGGPATISADLNFIIDPSIDVVLELGR